MFFIDARAEISVAESRLSNGILDVMPVKAQRFVSAKISLTLIAPDFYVVLETQSTNDPKGCNQLYDPASR